VGHRHAAPGEDSDVVVRQVERVRGDAGRVESAAGFQVRGGRAPVLPERV
jgi:hypothetical protein